MKRPDYSILDQEDREAQLASKNDVLSKSFVTDLWMKVINRAIDDIVMYQVKRHKGETLTEEDAYSEEDANSFLFNDEHLIPLEDYVVDVLCSKCGFIWNDKASQVSSNDSVCTKCKHKSSPKTVKYRFTEEQTIKEISLKELLSLWDINNIKEFREGVVKRIEKLTKKKKLSIDKRKQNKGKIMTEQENFIVPTEEEYSEFDKGIVKVLDEIKVLLMQKNRKYGNSATNPVRAFSKADPKEQIKIRIDDKISRLVRSKGEKEDEDVNVDLIGYLVILTALDREYIS